MIGGAFQEPGGWRRVIFIHKPDVEEIVALVLHERLLEEMDHVSLDRMTTHDFVSALEGTDHPWHEGEPFFFSFGEEAGPEHLVIQVNRDALRYVLEHPELFDARVWNDWYMLAGFVEQHGIDQIYQMTGERL